MGGCNGHFTFSKSFMIDHLPLVLILLVPLLLYAVPTSAQTDSSGDADLKHRKGRFVRVFHGGKGYGDGAPWQARRVRVNDDTAASSGWTSERDETWSNGILALHLDKDLDLRHLNAADVYVEYWGGHPGTTNKRFTLNGRSTYLLPERGGAEGVLTHGYDFIAVKVSDLVREDNALQFNCDKGTSFWGHFIVFSAQLWAELGDGHPLLDQAEYATFDPAVVVEPVAGREALRLSVAIPPALADRIDSIEFWGRYKGYDESGRGTSNTWHGAYVDGEPFAHLGTATAGDVSCTWDVSMVPDQTDMAVLARIRLKGEANVLFETGNTEGIATPDRPGIGVQLFSVDHAVPSAWAQFDGDKPAVLTRNITVRLNPAQVEQAQLLWTDWDGGKGDVEVPFHFNGHAIPVDSDARHISRYHVVDVDPDQMIDGTNVFQVSAHTTHHGIEVLAPGPALVVRYRTARAD